MSHWSPSPAQTPHSSGSISQISWYFPNLEMAALFPSVKNWYEFTVTNQYCMSWELWLHTCFQIKYMMPKSGWSISKFALSVYKTRGKIIVGETICLYYFEVTCPNPLHPCRPFCLVLFVFPGILPRHQSIRGLEPIKRHKNPSLYSTRLSGAQ